MTVNTILGSTVINQWELELKFNPNKVVSHKLCTTFELEFTDTTHNHAPIPIQEPTASITVSANWLTYTNPSDISTSRIAVLVTEAAGEARTSSGSASASYARG